MSQSNSRQTTVIGKLTGHFKRMGVVNTLLHGLARLLKKAGLGSLHRYHLCAQPIKASTAQAGRGAIKVIEVSEADYQPAWFPRPARVIADRFRQGATCLVAFQGDVPIGFIWLIRNSYLEDEVRCHYILSPSDTTVWDFDVFLHPNYRLGRGFMRLWAAADAMMLAEGRHWSLSRIDAFNRASLRAHQSRGARIVGDLLFLRIGRIQLMLGNCSPYCHLSVNPSRAPQVTVTPVCKASPTESQPRGSN